MKTNKRIREGIGYDGYFDYELAVRDKSLPGYMKIPNPDKLEKFCITSMF